jgi:hypothetical protein
MAAGAGIRYLAIALRRRQAKVMVSRVFVAQLALLPAASGSGAQHDERRGRLPALGPGPVGVASFRWGRRGSPGDWRCLARTANGAPLPGAPSHGHVPPGYQACTFTAVVGRRWSAPLQLTALLRPLFACHGTPPAAGRAWVPGFRVRTIGPCFLCTGPCRLWKACGVMDSLSQSIEQVACPRRARRWPPAGPQSSENAVVADLSPVMRCCVRLLESA